MKDSPALRGGALSFYWIIIGLKKGGVAVVWPVAGHSLLPVAVGSCESHTFCSCFPVIFSPADKLRRVNRQSCLTRT